MFKGKEINTVTEMTKNLPIPQSKELREYIEICRLTQSADHYRKKVANWQDIKERE